MLDGFVTPPRTLTILGSGETSPTMVTPHQAIFAGLAAALGGSPRTAVPAVVIDTPFGFQENADDLTEKLRAYFLQSVGREVAAVRFRSTTEAEQHPAEHARALATLRTANWIFAGPGSPTYALRTWTPSPMSEIVVDRLTTGPCAAVFASAASLTIGVATVPVYEIYKAGEDPRWLTGLNILERVTGIRAAVIPHFDNNEGGGHDTRFCYLGERRLSLLENELPDDTFVLGVDEHTGVILDLDSRIARVIGRGALTIRRDGNSTVFATGTSVSFDDLVAAGGSRGSAPVVAVQDDADSPAVIPNDLLVAGDVRGAVDAALDQLPQLPRADVADLLVRLGDLAASPRVDVAGVIDPYVSLLLEQRREARATKRFADSDAIRDALIALGLDIRDTPDGVTWTMNSEASA